MDTMKKGREFRTIQIPEWMDAAISDLAAKHKRNTDVEIEFLVKAAIEHSPKPGSGPDPAPGLQEVVMVAKGGRR
jgi:hypothetical protein